MEETYQDIYQLVGKIFFAFTGFTLLFGFTRIKEFHRNNILFFIYLVTTFIYNSIEQFFLWSVNIHTDWWLPWLNKYKIIDTNFLALYGRLIDIAFLIPFYIGVLELKPKRNWLGVNWLLFFSCMLIAIYIDGWRNYGTVNSIINRSLLIILPLAYIWKLNSQLPSLSLWKNPYFLISFGILLPNLLSIVMSFIGDKLSATDYVLFIKVSLFRLLVSFIGQILFIRAFMFSKFEKFLV